MGNRLYIVYSYMSFAEEATKMTAIYLQNKKVWKQPLTMKETHTHTHTHTHTQTRRKYMHQSRSYFYTNANHIKSILCTKLKCKNSIFANFWFPTFLQNICQYLMFWYFVNILLLFISY